METLDDVMSWLQVGLKALVPLHQQAIDALELAKDYIGHCHGCSIVPRQPTEDAIIAARNTLDNHLNLYTITRDVDFVMLDAFTISRTEWDAGTGSTEKVQGFLIEVSVPFRGPEGQPDADVAEVGRCTSAVEAAKMVISTLFARNLSDMIQGESEARRYAKMEEEAKQVF